MIHSTINPLSYCVIFLEYIQIKQEICRMLFISRMWVRGLKMEYNFVGIQLSDKTFMLVQTACGIMGMEIKMFKRITSQK